MHKLQSQKFRTYIKIMYSITRERMLSVYKQKHGDTRKVVQLHSFTNRKHLLTANHNIATTNLQV